jgi:hypothetical protein
LLNYHQFLNNINIFNFNFFEVFEEKSEKQITLGGIFAFEVELDTGWPWPLDAVQKFFEDMWNAIVNIPARVWDGFRPALQGTIDWLWGNIARPIVRFTWEVYNITWEWTSGWPEPWATIGKFLLFPAAFAYKFLRDYIGPAISDAVDNIRKYFDGAVSGIFDAIRNAFSPIFEPLATFASAAYDFFTKTVPSFVKGAIDFFVNLPNNILNIFNWLKDTFWAGINTLVNFFTKTVPEWFDQVLKFFGLIGDFFTKTLPDWFGQVADFFSKLPGQIFKFFTEDFPKALGTAFGIVWDWLNTNVIQPIQKGLEGLWKAIEEGIKGFLKAVLDFFVSIPKNYEELGLEGVLMKFLPILGAGFGIAIAIDIASIKVLGSGVDLEEVRAFINNTVLKFFDISLFTSVFFAIAVQKPLEYIVKRTFRTERPGPGDSLDFLKKDIITEDQAMFYLQIAGYPDEIARQYIRSIYKEPDFISVFTAFQRGKIDFEEYRVWLKVLNIDKAELLSGTFQPYKVLEEAAYRLPSPFLLSVLVETGEISEDVLKDILKYELIHPRFLDITVKGLMWRGLRDERSLLRKQIIESFMDGAMRIPVFVNYLSLLGITGPFANSIVEVADFNRRRMIRKKALQYLEKQFLEGYINRQDFITQATQFDFDPDLLHEYAILLEYIRNNYMIVKETKDERSRFAAFLQSKFKAGYDDEITLRNKLIQLRLNLEEVDLRVNLAKEEDDFATKEMLKEAYLAAFRAEKIDENQLRNLLTSLGLRTDKIEAIITAENYRKKVQPVKVETLAERLAKIEFQEKQQLAHIQDLGTDLEAKERIYKAAQVLWEERIRKIKEEIEITVDPARKERLMRQLTIMQQQAEIALTRLEKELTDLKEKIQRAESKLDEIRREKEAIKKAMGS